MSDTEPKSGSPVPNPNEGGSSPTGLNKSADAPTNDVAQPTETAKSTGAREKLAAAKKAANEAAIITSIQRMEMFDSTQAGDWQTKSMIKPKIASENESGYKLLGRAIGAAQREPEWTPQQRKAITQAIGTEIGIENVNDSRRAQADPNEEYVEVDESGNAGPTEKAYLSSIDPNEYLIGIGRANYDETGQEGKYYMDAVMAGSSGSWLLNQWTSDLCVLDGIDPTVLTKATRQGNKSGRKIGVNFARIGLPKFAYGPLFNSLSKKYDGFMKKVSVTDGYYWMNASWGVTTSPGQFLSVNERTRETEHTNILSDVMRNLKGRSALGLATVAISVTFGVTTDASGKNHPNYDDAGISVKLHSFVMMREVDYHGPQQQLATAMKIPQSMLNRAKGLSGNATLNTGGGMGSVFASIGNKEATGNAGGSTISGKTAPSTKTTDSTVFMK